MAQTDNSLLAWKVWLRVDHLPAEPVRVLDCYGGHGMVWDSVRRVSQRSDIIRTGIDVENRERCVRGDNRKWLKGIDLARFNVIDLDAYGIPFDQCKILFDKKYRGTVFFTFIQTMMGSLPVRLLAAHGITKDMRKQCPTLYAGLGWQLWLSWLADNGVERVWYRSDRQTESGNGKRYGGFRLE